MKDLIILGSTGSIGTQTLDIVRKYPNEYNIIALSLGRDMEKNIKIIDEFKPLCVCARTEEDKNILTEKYPNLIITCSDNGLKEVACFQRENKNVLLVVAVVGSIGLIPTVEAVKIGRNIALANKETLVTAGEIVMDLARKHNVTIFPIDSEHSAIYQILLGENKEDIKRLVITASGGSFRNLKRNELENVTVDEALNHPNWKMGSKITIDSSTMMNKGFEVIEAHHLFDLPYEKISTILHKESIVHSMVEFNDSSIKAHLGNADMHIPILYALSYPKRVEYNNSLNLLGLNLTFEEMDFNRYPCLEMAYNAAVKGNIFPTILNASNDMAVNLFLEGKIKYLEIEEIIKEELEQASYVKELTLEIILEKEKEIKEKIFNKYGRGL
jgi:1-deoxy-D-xylulose-5-phosphate reductoisomerase